MNFIKEIERIKKLHLLIREEKTGTPNELAKQLHIGRSRMYDLLDVLKELDATIKYCKKKESFYYDKPFELVLKYSLKTIVDEETREIFGGFNFRPILSDGSILNLQ